MTCLSGYASGNNVRLTDDERLLDFGLVGNSIGGKGTAWVVHMGTSFFGGGFFAGDAIVAIGESNSDNEDRDWSLFAGGEVDANDITSNV